jgi:hypothetical protein
MPIKNALSELMARDGFYALILAALLKDYGMCQFGEVKHFTFEVAGDEVILTDENRKAVESAIGCELLVVTGIQPYNRLSGLIAPSSVIDQVRDAVEEFESTQAIA